jgi:hypothetical protein
MTINKVRSLLYGIAKLLGDINAFLKGRILERVARRAAGKVVGRLLGRLFR